MQINDYIVETPEQIELAYDVAGIGSRFLAAIIDSTLIILAEVALFLAIAQVASILQFADSVWLAIRATLGFVIVWGYYIAFELTWNGQSPGKRLIGLRVVTEGGRPITVLGSIIRNLIRIIDFLPLFYGIGVIAMFIDGRARRLGDLAASTLVVRERTDVTLESLVAGVAPNLPLLSGDTADRIDVSLLTPDDYVLLCDFLDQRRDLAPPVRRQLAMQLGEGLQARLDLPPDDPERLVERVVHAYWRQRRPEERQ
ncbi:MAG: RDD family protein [Roseiflexus sp.]|uniref:RDD family protein n=1 Tax=Roseiflexus sp. TaxID=2562120 RepID=UPI0025D90782|nr:RDD family protein [Roseiflexus sp.]MCL6539859.1 RDD family protein [Roseiflexus sp.]